MGGHALSSSAIGSEAPPPAAARTSLGVKLGYSAGTIAGAGWGVLGGLALFFYNQVVGVPAHLVGLALGMIVFIDAIWDPVIGQCSDRFRSKMGRRHPFMYVAMLLVPAALLIRWHPPTDWSDMHLFYFIFASGLFMSFASSLFDVPASALAPELAPDYHDRTSLMSFRVLFGMVGAAIMSILSYGVFLRPTAEYPVGQLNPEGYGSLAIAVTIVALMAMTTLVLTTRRQAASFQYAPVPSSSLGEQLRDAWGTLSNRNFAVAALAAALVGIGAGVTSGLSLYMSTYFWELGSSEILVLTLSFMVGAPVAVILAPVLGRRFGKRNTCIVALLGGATCTSMPLFLRLMGVFPENNSPLLLPILFATFAFTAVMSICGTIMVSSMVTDVVEDAQAQTGRRAEGLIISADTLPQKLLASVSVAVPGVLLTFVGFPTGAQPGQVDPEILRTLAWWYMPINIGFAVASALSWSLFRIDEKSHAGNLAKIAART